MTKGTLGSFGVGSDAYPIVVTEVINDKTIKVSNIEYRATPDSVYHGNQKYEYFPDKIINNTEITLTLRKNNKWKIKGEPLNDCRRFNFGMPYAYQDPHF